MFTFSVELEKLSFHVADLPRMGKKCTGIRRGHRENGDRFSITEAAKTRPSNERVREHATRKNVLDFNPL